MPETLKLSGKEINKEEVIAVKNISNPGSAIGEAVGKLVELEISELIKRVIAKSKKGFIVDSGGPIEGRRIGKKLLMRDRAGNDYEIDIVVEDSTHKPIILIESKWLRYKKHNRDKGSWVCTAHYSLRKTFTSIRKTMVVLIGNWSETSIKLMESFGIEVQHVPYTHVVEQLGKYNIPFDWDEKDRKTATIAWNNFNKLTEEELRKLAYSITQNILNPIEKSVADCLMQDCTLRDIREVELTIKSNIGEFFNKDFKTIEEAISYLQSFSFE